MRIAHVIADDISPAQLRLATALIQAGGAGALAVVDHGSALGPQLAQAGILPQGAALTSRARWMPAFRTLTQLLWEHDVDVVHLHGCDDAALPLAVARWLDLPVIVTPRPGEAQTARVGLWARLWRGSPWRRADGVVLLQPETATPWRAGTPVLVLGEAASQAGRYRGFVAEVCARFGRETLLDAENGLSGAKVA